MNQQTIGRCEGFCGRVDHDLVKGLCGQCRAAAIDMPLEGEHSCNDPLPEDIQNIVREVAVDPLADAYRDTFGVEIHA